MRQSASGKSFWEVAERVYFCFDLMLMLRAMLDECPELALDTVVQPGPAAVEAVGG
jgi:hypothetical protein